MAGFILAALANDYVGFLLNVEESWLQMENKSLLVQEMGR
jgi:hypothetical protein